MPRASLGTPVPGLESSQAPQDPQRIFSVSGLKCYEDCPVRYYYQYVKKAAPPPTAAMKRGTSVHKLIEDFLEKGVLPDVELDEKQSRLWNHFWRSRFNRKPIYTEQSFTYGFGDWGYSGRIDVVQKNDLNRVEVVDFKTGWPPSSREDLVKDLQLPLYALAVSDLAKVPKEAVDFSWFFLYEGIEYSFSFSENVEKSILSRLGPIVSNIQGKHWWIRRCGRCWGCERVQQKLNKAPKVTLSDDEARSILLGA